MKYQRTGSKGESDYFVNKNKRSEQIGRYFKEEMKNEGYKTRLEEFNYLVNNGRYQDAYKILDFIVDSAIVSYNQNGLPGIGYVLQKNKERYGYEKTLYW